MNVQDRSNSPYGGKANDGAPSVRKNIDLLILGIVVIVVVALLFVYRDQNSLLEALKGTDHTEWGFFVPDGFITHLLITGSFVMLYMFASQVTAKNQLIVQGWFILTVLVYFFSVLTAMKLATTSYMFKIGLIGALLASLSFLVGSAVLGWMSKTNTHLLVTGVMGGLILSIYNAYMLYLVWTADADVLTTYLES